MLSAEIQWIAARLRYQISGMSEQLAENTAWRIRNQATREVFLKWPGGILDHLYLVETMQDRWEIEAKLIDEERWRRRGRRQWRWGPAGWAMDDAMAALALAAGEARTRRMSLIDVINARKPTPMKERALRCIKEQDIAHSRELLNLPPAPISRDSVIIESTNWLIPEEPPQPRRGRKVKRITRRMKKEKEEKAARNLEKFADLSRELIDWLRWFGRDDLEEQLWHYFGWEDPPVDEELMAQLMRLNPQHDDDDDREIVVIRPQAPAA